MTDKSFPSSLWLVGSAIQAGLATGIAEPISRAILNTGFDAGRLLVTFLLAASAYLLIVIPLMRVLPMKIRGSFLAWLGIAIVCSTVISSCYLIAQAMGFFPTFASAAVLQVVWATAATGGLMSWIMTKIT